MKIAIVSDTHLSAGRPHFVYNWHCVASDIRGRNFQLLGHAGDHCLNAMSNTREMRFAKNQLDGVGIPFRAIPGNDDIGEGTWQRPPPNRQVSQMSLENYNANFGDSNWLFEIEDYFVAGLNAQVWGFKSRDERLLRETLNALRGQKRIIVFTHKPVFLPSSNLEGSWMQLPAAFASAIRAVTDSDAEVTIISGHLHTFLDFTQRDWRQIVVPSTAFLNSACESSHLGGNNTLGYLSLELGREGLAVELVEPPSMIIHDIKRWMMGTGIDGYMKMTASYFSVNGDN